MKWTVERTTLALVALSIVGILGWGFWLASVYRTLETISPTMGTLEFWYESCGVGYPWGTCICAVSLNPVTLPQTFKMSTVVGDEVTTLHTYYFGTQLNPETKVLFSINATAPVNFQLVLVNRTDPDVHALANEVAYFSRVIINASHITSYYHELNVQEKGLFIFVFDVVQPKPVATVTFRAERGD